MVPVPYEQVNKSEFFPEVETAVEVYREVMEEKDLGRALNPTERISVFLDPRRKMMSEDDDCVGGGNALQTMVISDIEELGHHFVENIAQNSSRTPAPGLATPAVTLPRVSSVIK